MYLQRGLTAWLVKKVMGKESIYENFIMVACDRTSQIQHQLCTHTSVAYWRLNLNIPQLFKLFNVDTLAFFLYSTVQYMYC